MTKPTVAKKSVQAKHQSAGGGKAMSGAPQKLLDVVAQLAATSRKDEVCRKQATHMTGIQGKSTIANAITKLKTFGFVVVTPDTITVTAKGKDAAQPIDPSTIPTNNKEYQELKKDQCKLTAKALELFDVLADGRAHPKADVAAAIGCKLNSTFANLCTKLKKNEIITFDKATIQLSPSMFPFPE